MESNADNQDIENVLRLLGKKLSSMSEDNLEAFFDKLFSSDNGVVKSALAVKLKGPRVITAVNISRPLLDELKQHMVENGIRSSVSSVVEFLVWDYLGCPDELIEKAPRRNKRRGRPPGIGPAPTEADILANWTEAAVNKIIEESNERNSEETQETD